MWNYILILLFQIGFNIFKVREIQLTYDKKVTPLLWNSVLINLISLASTYYSIDGLFNGDFGILPFYIGGSIVGKWIALEGKPYIQRRRRARQLKGRVRGR
jgi:hypothetical protein